jgi:hypothetical protein
LSLALFVCWPSPSNGEDPLDASGRRAGKTWLHHRSHHLARPTGTYAADCPYACDRLPEGFDQSARFGDRGAGQTTSSFGTSYHAMMQMQIARGEAALMVLYPYDFVAGEAALTHRGKLQLLKISALTNRNDFPIIIQGSPGLPALDEARRSIVIAEMNLLPYPVPADRVIVGRPLTRGLDGIDAELIHQNLLGLTAAGQAIGTQPAAAGPVIPVPAR